MSQQVSFGEIAPTEATTRTRVTVRAVLAEIFGPRPLESALWGLGIGVAFGLPLILAYFVSHFWAVQLQLILTGIGPEPGFDGTGFGVLFWIGFTVLGFGIVGTAVLSTLVALLRRASLATTLLVAFLVGLVPYLLFYLLFVSGL